MTGDVLLLAGFVAVLASFALLAYEPARGLVVACGHWVCTWALEWWPMSTERRGRIAGWMLEHWYQDVDL